MSTPKESDNLAKALKLEPLAGIGSPPGTVNLVTGITYLNAVGIIIAYSFEFLLKISKQNTPEFVWQIESPGKAAPLVCIDGEGNRIPFAAQGGIFIFDDESMLLVTQLESVHNLAARYILPPDLKTPGSGLTKQSIQGFDPSKISVFRRQGKNIKVQAETLEAILP